MDVAFLRGRMYALVTLVGGDIVGGPHLGDATVGIYRLERDGTWRVTADIGTWSAAHPPATDFFITTGVQYAMTPYGNGFLVTDGHHNRVLQVGLDGSVRQRVAVADVVPTGLETDGRRVWFTEAGPTPHEPRTGRLLSLGPGGRVSVQATGARLAVDVEEGPSRRLYLLSQGTWDGPADGTPALPDTGHLYAVGQGGHLAAVRDCDGAPIVLDRPTSLEIVGHTAYVVSFSGDLYRIRGL
ncbi:hypothetical protein BN12_2790001 [Nostocoides japonicum T1-X7]|uniref:Uncharacterized protein n=2 Tax=Nostocoides japonicum TaxID=99481 RepID=A0A077LWN8_9MICO|nr:hypothetical protein BN12_2790001 [Tetrasphaera japonica T1-X7]